ncbi:MAG: 4Fe-4S dicluster domain-containing protein [Candidatus Marinimicrobia bacterium]|nr:4Fe-4S dicluster domain-containing protein [Candidatus Neomarinimicrobiota bacterium]
MKTLYLPQIKIGAFLSHLTNMGIVYAPHKKGDASFTFETVKSMKDVILDYPRTLNSIKKYFLPPKEQLMSFSMEDYSITQNELYKSEIIFFGVHSYDMQAVMKLDYNFSQGNPERNYLSRRENSTFIGISFTPDEYHFSRSVGITVEETDGFDLFLDRTNDGYNVTVLTDRGADLVNNQSYFMETATCEIPNQQFHNKIKYNYNRLPEVFDQVWNSPVWDQVAAKCVGCGTCNLVCPTCYCFNVDDEVDLDLKNGSRQRTWDGCMLNNFAAVAGGENFRKSLAERQRHRIYRKFKYITDVTGEPWCVGCGRCTAYCTADISIVDIVNRLSEEYEQNHLQKQSPHILHEFE